MENFKKFYPSLEYCNDFYDAITDSDCMVIMTDWNDFKIPNW
jgi:UDP-glucose 6-dehydrogenase